MKAYFVTTHTSLYGYTGREKSRIVGFFPKLETAVSVVENNIGDIHEDGYYRHATIETIQSGLYPANDRQTLFYEWNNDVHKYVRIARRPGWVHFGNFSGIG